MHRHSRDYMRHVDIGNISIEKVLQLSNISTKLVLALGATYQAVSYTHLTLPTILLV